MCLNDDYATTVLAPFHRLLQSAFDHFQFHLDVNWGGSGSVASGLSCNWWGVGLNGRMTDCSVKLFAVYGLKCYTSANHLPLHYTTITTNTMLSNKRKMHAFLPFIFIREKFLN